MSHHTFCWVDIPVTNLDRAIAFYSLVFGEEVKKISQHGFEFGLFPHTDENVSGCLCVMEDRQPSRDGLQVYLNVEGRLADAVRAAKENGGQLVKDIEQIGPYGHRAVILDTEGNSIALYSKEA